MAMQMLLLHMLAVNVRVAMQSLFCMHMNMLHG